MTRLTELEAGPGGLAEYYDWFKDAGSGDVLVYYRGDLSFDRDPDNQPDLTDETRELVVGVDALAKRVMRDSQDGYLVLTQRKLFESNYEYKAVRKRLPMERTVERTRTRNANFLPA